MGRVAVGNMARLAGKTPANGCCIGNMGTRRENEILGNHTVSNINRSSLITHDGSVLEPGTIHYFCVTSYPHVLYGPRIEYLYSAPDCPDIGSIFLGVIFNH
ncbi:hypothetical protein SDC9_126144 [bioreactor metagenome]|uniref:Uncharacterized protein n=1 Tax=bioreactor metagenome TaxID=1076179 RepID=A0A645CQA6_9ZZZZ